MSKTIFPAVAIHSTPSLGGDLGLLGSVARAPSTVFGTLLVWQMRANQRTRLAEMESHRLEDMGITSSEAQREAAKPFWRA
jgi:uncharacterized protein YjiS (DUF1127 family)